MANPKLKPCPFCGCASVSMVQFEWGYWWFIQCNQCGANSAGSPTRSGAKARWNTRKGAPRG